MRLANTNWINLKSQRCALLLSVLFLLGVSITPIFAQTGGSYDLSWWAVVGGGGDSSGGSYTLNSSIGQPEAGVLISGGDYTVVGGFWPGGASGPDEDNTFYLPVILRE